MSRVLNQVQGQTGTSCTDPPQSGNRIQNVTNRTSPPMDTANNKQVRSLLNSPNETDTDEDSFHSAEGTPMSVQTKNQRRKTTKRQTTLNCCFHVESHNPDIAQQQGTPMGPPYINERLIRQVARMKQVFPLTTAKELYDIIIDEDPGFDCD